MAQRSAKRSLLGKITDGTFALCTAEEIARMLRLHGREVLAVREMLRALVREGELLCDSRARFGTAEQFGAKTGVIAGNERGFAFFTPDDGSGDLFLPRSALGNALHGDTVLAIRSGGGDAGEVLAVLSRGYKEIVGTYRREHRCGYLHPDERKFSEDVFIPAGKHRGCGNGTKAVAHIISYNGRTPIGEIVEILGGEGDLSVEELSVIRAHSLREEFPQEVLKAANEQEKRDPLSSLWGREDLREELIVTVDGEDTRDIDDAISVKRRGKFFELGVHIADVSHYVARSSALDREAFARGTSVYFPDRVLPMLPPALSNGICSLNEGVPRLTLSCIMKVDRAGNVAEKRIVPSVIKSRHRMTYTEMTALCERDPSALEKFPDMVEFASAAAELTGILKRARNKRGGITLDIKEAKILFEDGKISIPDYERTISHEMIEQFMVLANESVATLMTERKVPFVYRVHERPSEEKARDLLSFLSEIGVKAGFDPAAVSPADYRDLLASLGDSPLSSVVNRVMLRSMMKAQYSPENVGHFGLASECYCHFTSPIRRYPDLCIHRIIKAALEDPARARKEFSGFVEEAARQSSLCERNAAEAERDVDALYIISYMQDKIGEEYAGTVSGVNSYGLFIELKNTVEGFVPIETLEGDRYEYYEDRMLLRGRGETFRIGDRVKVRVSGVDRTMRRTIFTYLGKEKP